MTDMILRIMAVGAVLGGLDCILGNRWGFGSRFEEAFQLLGSIGLSMAGIICLAPVLSRLLGAVLLPLCGPIGLDPGIFGSILAIDMGGYQMAMDLSGDPELGRFAGIVVSAIFGCTVVFTIPVGMGAVGEEDRPLFTRGILLGLASMPAGIVAGGLAAGISVGRILIFTLPVLLLSALLALGLWKKPGAVAEGFRVFARWIRNLAILGLMLGAVAYMTGWQLLKDMVPLEEAMEVVCSIAIVMLGSMPLTELLQRLLQKPFAWLGGKTGMNSVSMTALLIGMVSVVPVLAMFPRMDCRGKVANSAFLVCGAACFAAHLGFAAGVEPDLVGPLLTAKLLGGLTGALIALAATKKEETAS